jgi:hypothetical protein
MFPTMKSAEIQLYQQAGLVARSTDGTALEFNRSWNFSQMNTFFRLQLPKLFAHLAETHPHVLKTTAASVDDHLSMSPWLYILLVKDRRTYTVSPIEYPTAEDYLNTASRTSGGGSRKERTIHIRKSI